MSKKTTLEERKQEYQRFFNKCIEKFKITGELPEEIYTLEFEYNERYGCAFSTAILIEDKNLILVIAGRKTAPDRIRKLILHELLHAAYPYVSEEEIKKTTEDFWWAYKKGRW